MTKHGVNRNAQLITKAGAILRKLTPPRIATLLLVREGVESQKEMAQQLNRSPPTISNYIESLEDLPVPLVKTDGSDHWTTSEGNQVVSAIFRFASNHLGIDLHEGSWGGDTTAERLDELDSGLTPLHTFRSDPPFFILYALGTAGASGWMVDLSREPVPIETVVADVKDWLDDSITRKQIRSRLGKFETTSVIKIDGQKQETKLTEKGLEQCRLLDQVMQIFTDMSPTENENIAAMYQTDAGMTLSLPRSVTVDELEVAIDEFKQENEGDLTLELVAQTPSGTVD